MKVGASHALVDFVRSNSLFQERLDRVDNDRTDNVFSGNLQHIPAGQATCSKLLHDCYCLVDVGQRSADAVSVSTGDERKRRSCKTMRQDNARMR